MQDPGQSPWASLSAILRHTLPPYKPREEQLWLASLGHRNRFIQQLLMEGSGPGDTLTNKTDSSEPGVARDFDQGSLQNIV